ncbi:DUF1467 family protein [Cochlodiniinecator piscidefendens]|uniref:DUF1467 family protein n=1 Tax=Cochlodiniinecator piscidefendens TaxID=2715756 RepID=UPI00140946E5|nr:DUF1467 family protein [Cochlodiniinecator piscidefendens]
MTITAAIVLFAVIWFMTFLIVLPIRLKTQGDMGEIVPGTHAGAPHDPQLKKRAKITTLIAFVLWAGISYVILYGGISVRDLDYWGLSYDREIYGETSE